MGIGRDCGSTFLELFAEYDPESSLWRTSQGCLMAESGQFCRTWPKSGSMQNGRCYRRLPLALRNYAKECLLWPTPGANDWKGSFRHGQRRGQLDEAIENMPAWVSCPCCEEYLCLIHMIHACDCDCPAIEEWLADPYTARAGGRLHPAFSEWLQGFPEGWTDCDH